MNWLRKVWKTLTDLLSVILNFVFQAFTHYDQVVDDIVHIVQASRAAKLNIENEVNSIRNFKFDPKWHSRVINVPTAARQIQDLKALVFDDFKERLETIVEPFHELSLVLHQEAPSNASDPQGAVAALAKCEVKLGHVVTTIHQLRNSLDEVYNFIDIFRQLRENLEGLDAIFLQQGNSRAWKTEHLRRRVRRL